MADIKATMSLDGSGVSTGIQNVTRSVSSLSTKLAGAFGIGFGTAFLKSTIDATAAIGDMAEETGLTIREVQILRNSANDAGANFDKVKAAVSRVVDALGNAKAGGPMLAAFQKIGIGGEQIKALDVPAALASIGAAAESAQPGTAQFSAILDILGTKMGPQAAQALQMFAQSINKVQQSGPIISDEAVQNVKYFQDSLQETITELQAWLVMAGQVIAGSDKPVVGLSGNLKARLALEKLEADRKAALAAPKFGDVQLKELATLEKQAQASYEKTLAAQEQLNLLDGTLTKEQQLLQIQNEKLRIANQLEQLGNKTDFESQKARLILQVQQDEAVAKELKLREDTVRENKRIADERGKSDQQLFEEGQKRIEESWREERKQRHEKNAIEAKAQEDIAKLATSVSVSPMAVDQLARIGGQVGGASNPMLTVAMRHLKIAEETEKITLQMQKDIAKLDLGLGA